MATNPELNIEKDVIDLDLSVTKKKRFRFDKDDSRIIDLNIADMGIMSRLTETYPKLTGWLKDTQTLSAEISDDDSIEAVSRLGEKLNEIDKSMRDAIDYIFNAELSRVAAPDGTMYDMFEGQFRFEYILSTLLDYYENNMSEEFKKMQTHTKKYTKKG